MEDVQFPRCETDRCCDFVYICSQRGYLGEFLLPPKLRCFCSVIIEFFSKYLVYSVHRLGYLFFFTLDIIPDDFDGDIISFYHDRL